MTPTLREQIQRLATSRCRVDAPCYENWPHHFPADAENYCQGCWVRLQDLETAFALAQQQDAQIAESDQAMETDPPHGDQYSVGWRAACRWVAAAIRKGLAADPPRPQEEP